MKIVSLFALALVTAGCFSSSRHISSVRPALVSPAKGLSEQYRLDNLTLEKPIVTDRVDKEKFSARHAEDTQKMLKVVREALYKNYPKVFVDSPSAHPLSVDVTWAISYLGNPIVHSILTNLVVPDDAEQETIYYVKIKDMTESWAVSKSAFRMSETWETWGLPIGFIPIPGRSDWPKTFCFLRMGKDSLVGGPNNKSNGVDYIRDLVFEPKVDGDVIAALIMKAVNQHYRDKSIDELLAKGGVK